MSTTRNEHTHWTGQLSAYLDGELAEDDFRAVEAHLAECGPCRLVLEELRDVVTQASELGGMELPRDLWGGIAATIQAPAPRHDETKVIALPTAAAVPHPVGARIAVSVPQLIAASVVLIAASSMATWLAGPGLGVRGGEVAESAIVGDPAVTMAAAGEAMAPPPGLAEELAELEQALVEAQSLLDPNTVRVLEQNLGVIEQAIEDSQRALAQDPGNEFLAEHLERVYQRKLTYLQDVSRMAEWSS